MNPLIKLLGQLNQNEKDDLTSWLSSLDKKEHETVMSFLAGATVDDVRQILSVPAGQRMSLFSVKRNFLEEANRGIEEHPVARELKAQREKLFDKLRNTKWK